MDKTGHKPGIHRRAQRALARQLNYQEQKASRMRGREANAISAMIESSRQARSFLQEFRPIDEHARVLEVGSGAHGLIFFFGARNGVGVDPLAHSYVSLFPAWQRRVATIAAFGESLPFADQSFDLVFCDNVVDHAESPAGIVTEIVRVLAPGGLLYFTVNVHHPIYALASRAHAAWHRLGINYEVAPFADHTVHLTLGKAKQMFAQQPLQFLDEASDVRAAKALARRRALRHVRDRIKRLFFKNALYRLVAIRRE